MFITKSLDPDKLPCRLSDFGCICSDLDLTLVDFLKGHDAAVVNLHASIGKKFALEFQNVRRVAIAYVTKLKSFGCSKTDFLQFKESFAKVKKFLGSGYGIRTVSREMWIMIAAMNLGMSISSKEVIRARDIYWDAVTKNSPLLEDAILFLGKIYSLKIPFYIMTASDGMLNMDSEGNLFYDPEYAKTYKMKRVTSYKIDNKGIVVGDPHDKPEILFFTELLQLADTDGKISKDKILFVGDSIPQDLQVPESMGYSVMHVNRRL